MVVMVILRSESVILIWNYVWSWLHIWFTLKKTQNPQSHDKLGSLENRRTLILASFDFHFNNICSVHSRATKILVDLDDQAIFLTLFDTWVESIESIWIILTSVHDWMIQTLFSEGMNWCWISQNVFRNGKVIGPSIEQIYIHKHHF